MGYGATELHCIANGICIKCQRVRVENRRRCERCRRKLNARDLERQGIVAIVKRKVRAMTRRQTRSYQWAKEQQEEVMKSNAQIRAALAELTEEQRQKVFAIVKRYIRACRSQNVALDTLARVWVEAHDEVLRGDLPEQPWRYEAAWHYQQYVAPREGY